MALTEKVRYVSKKRKKMLSCAFYNGNIYLFIPGFTGNHLYCASIYLLEIRKDLF